MKQSRNRMLQLLIGLGALGVVACSSTPPTSESTSDPSTPASNLSESQPTSAASSPNEPKPTPPQVALNRGSCQVVGSGYGPEGQVPVRAETVVSGLEVPWGIAFLPNGDWLVTERPGRIRLVRDGKLQPAPVATVTITNSAEGGLLGIAAHPNFAANRWFYIYYTLDKNGQPLNRVERWQLAPDGLKATRDRIILDNIPAAVYHDGGRLRFGPDGMLYIGTGDARDPDLAQDVNSLAGKILRLTPDGQVPSDNPFPGKFAFITGIRNTQGFDWPTDSILWVTDHGPSGDLGRSAHDEVSVAQAGDNLGWPTIYRCQTRSGMVSPQLTWASAVPPGGAAIYKGNTIPEWQGSLLIGSLRSRHLQRVVFDPSNPGRVQSHEVYFQDELGRLREVVMGPDGELYVTTSNCDGRGSCPAAGDRIVRITR